MSKRSVWSIGFCVVLISIFVVYGMSSATLHPAAARPPARDAQSACVPVAVAVYDNRIHVECMNAAFHYFAAPLDAPNVGQFMTVLTTAMSSIPTMELLIGYYDDTTSGPVFGCLAQDCRRIMYVRVGLKPGAPLN